MGNIEKLLDPLGSNTFFKYDLLFEKHLTNLQNLMLYITSGKNSQTMTNDSLTHACYIFLSSLDLVLKT